MKASWVFFAAAVLRFALLLYGEWQDANSEFPPIYPRASWVDYLPRHSANAVAVKYTDIDYYVYTDAARFVLEVRTRPCSLASLWHERKAYTASRGRASHRTLDRRTATLRFWRI